MLGLIDMEGDTEGLILTLGETDGEREGEIDRLIDGEMLGLSDGLID